MNIWTSTMLTSIPWIFHGTSTRAWGSLRYPNSDETEDPAAFARADFLMALGANPEKLVVGGNVHGKRVHVLRDLETGVGHVAGVARIHRHDALVTSLSGVAIGIKSADCLPIFFVDTEKRTVAIAHAGWQGVMRGIAREVVDALQQTGTDVSHIVAAIGPSIRSCHYRVHADRREEMLAYTPHISSEDFYGDFVDLQGIVTRQLVHAGIAREHIEATAPCTACHPETFSSYHLSRDPHQGMLSVIGIRENF